MSDFYSKGRDYWQQVEPNMDGMLGGLTEVNIPDADESRGLLKRIFRQLKITSRENNPLRALDCGAGIGRVTKFVLSFFFDEVDLLEQNKTFLECSKNYLGASYAKICHTFAQGIHEFEPLPDVTYDCIWCQWVCGYITDTDIITFLRKCANILRRPHGFIVIKDNITNSDDCIRDDEDGSITRTHEAFQRIFFQVNELKLKCTVKQKKIPKDLYPVRMYVLTLASNK